MEPFIFFLLGVIAGGLLYLILSGKDSDENQKSILSHLKLIKMTIEEAVTKINAQRTQLSKISAEVSAIKQALADAQENGDNVPKALADAIEGSGSDIQAIDDLNEDAEV